MFGCISRFFHLFSSGHNLKYAVPTRTPPDAELFPYYIQNKQGLWLRYTEWWSETGRAGPVRGVVFVVCGLGEHTGRYDSVALRLTREGYAVLSVDNQGSGGSEGVRLYVERFGDFVDDIQLFVRRMLLQYPSLSQLPRFLLGHSMGGLIATHVALRGPSYFTGVILSGPALGSPLSQPPPPLVLKVFRLLSRYIPKLPLPTKVDPEVANHQQSVTCLLEQDPRYSADCLRVRFLVEAMRAQEDIHKKMSLSTFPFLIVFGEDDKLCSIDVARQFYEEALSTDKDMKTYPGAAHEVLTELCRAEVLKDVVEFIKKRTV